VLLLDELGVLPDRTRNNLANVLRALHTLRLISPTLAKLRIILAGGIEIYNLAVVEASALRNVCEIVRLDNLSEADALNMVTDGLVSIGMSATDALLFSRAIYQRVYGHPYLTQRLGQLLAAEHLAGSRIPPQGFVETRCWDVLESGNDPLLEHLRRSIDEFELEDVAWRLLSESQRTIRADAAMERLSLLGLAQRTGRCWTPRNPLFSVALAEWLRLGVPRTGDIISRSVAIRQKAIEQHREELQEERLALDEEINRATLTSEKRRLRQRRAVIEEEIDELEAILTKSEPETTEPLPTGTEHPTTGTVIATHQPPQEGNPPLTNSSGGEGAVEPNQPVPPKQPVSTQVLDQAMAAALREAEELVQDGRPSDAVAAQRSEVSQRLRDLAALSNDWRTLAHPNPVLRNRAATMLDQLGGDRDRPGLDLSKADYWADRIAPGTFSMGDDNRAYSDGRPQFDYMIRQPYALGRFPVTNRQYLLFMEALAGRGTAEAIAAARKLQSLMEHK